MANTKKETEEKTTKKNNTKTSKTTTTKKTAKKTTTTKRETVKKTTAPKKEERKVPAKKVEEKIVEKEETTSNKNNITKVVVISVSLVIFFIIIIAIGNSSNKGTYTTTNNTNQISTGDAQGESASLTEEEMGELTNIGIDKYLELKAGDDYAVIYIGRPTCSHCQVQLPIMRHIVHKYGITVNYLNTDELDQKGIEKLQKSDDYFSEGWGTPLVLVVSKNKIVDKIEGEASIEDVTSLLEQYEIINK